MRKLLIFLVVLSVSFNTYAKSEKKLSYQSFVDYAKSGKIKSLEIADFGIDDMKAIIIKDGKEVEYSVDRPYRAGEDIVFVEFLKRNKVPYEITEKPHDIGISFWLTSIPGLLLFLLPIIILIFLLVLMSRSKRIEHILKNIQNNRIKQDASVDNSSQNI